MSENDAFTAARAAKPISELDSVTVRFAGDSGDGMQLAGMQLASTSALAGNDVATFPDYPSEIRAPQGHAGWRERFSGPFRFHGGLHAR